MKTNNTFEPHAYFTICNWGRYYLDEFMSI